MNNDDYKPIECGLHSEYELAIMHKSKIQLIWIDDDGQELCVLAEPVDLMTREKQEYLKILTENNSLLEIRLDKIQHFKVITHK